MNDIERYANGVSRLNNFSESETLFVDTIVNPSAGFFRRKKTLQKIITELETQLRKLKDQVLEKRVEINNVHFTEYPGHAREITENIVEAELKHNSGIERLIVSAGGDGTGNEICSTLMDVDEHITDKIKLLRFPLGSGNDNSDVKTFSEAYRLILGTQYAEKTGAIEIVSRQFRTYVFNIASIGLDAYVTYLTNFFKRMIPGETYKFMVNLGTLFYTQRIKPEELDVVFWRNGQQKAHFEKKLTMLVMGVSGRRTYGGGMNVLPGNENVCVVDDMSIFKKLGSKGLMYHGKHGILEQIHFYSADHAVIDYRGACIPLQIDGEDYLLGQTTFPISMKVLKEKIRVVKK